LLPSFLTYGTHWMREKLFWLHVLVQEADS
jgi:hypothetical protein